MIVYSILKNTWSSKWYPSLIDTSCADIWNVNLSQINIHCLTSSRQVFRLLGPKHRISISMNFGRFEVWNWQKGSISGAYNWLKSCVYGAFFCKKGGETFPAQKTAVKAHNPAPVTDLFHLITGTVNCKKGK